MRISYWSSDVCSSDLERGHLLQHRIQRQRVEARAHQVDLGGLVGTVLRIAVQPGQQRTGAELLGVVLGIAFGDVAGADLARGGADPAASDLLLVDRKSTRLNSSH